MFLLTIPPKTTNIQLSSEAAQAEQGSLVRYNWRVVLPHSEPVTVSQAQRESAFCGTPNLLPATSDTEHAHYK